jgi:hypothetical protein
MPTCRAQCQYQRFVWTKIAEVILAKIDRLNPALNRLLIDYSGSLRWLLFERNADLRHRPPLGQKDVPNRPVELPVPRKPVTSQLLVTISAAAGANTSHQ